MTLRRGDALPSRLPPRMRGRGGAVGGARDKRGAARGVAWRGVVACPRPAAVAPLPPQHGGSLVPPPRAGRAAAAAGRRAENRHLRRAGAGTGGAGAGLRDPPSPHNAAPDTGGLGGAPTGHGGSRGTPAGAVTRVTPRLPGGWGGPGGQPGPPRPGPAVLTLPGGPGPGERRRRRFPTRAGPGRTRGTGLSLSPLPRHPRQSRGVSWRPGG